MSPAHERLEQILSKTRIVAVESPAPIPMHPVIPDAVGFGWNMTNPNGSNDGVVTSGLPVTAQRHMPPGIYHPKPTPMEFQFIKQKPRADNLVHIQSSSVIRLHAELSEFWGLEAKYRALGITHKRGVLLYGPPGTGKTASLYQVCEEFVRTQGGVVLWPNNVRDTDDAIQGFNILRAQEPDRHVIIVMEEIDRIGAPSWLLSFMDGGQQHNRVMMIGTTNHFDKLHKALTNRPSRFDVKIEIAAMPREVRAALMDHAYPKVPEELRTEIVNATDGMSVAEMKEVLVLSAIFNLPVSEAAERVRVSMQEAQAKKDEDEEDDD